MRNLINFLLKYNYWFPFILLEVASFVLLFRFNNYQQSTFFTSANVVVGAVYEVSGGISSYFHLKSVNADLLDRNMVLEQQITNLEKALREQQLDSMAINSIRQVPQADYQLFKAHVIKNSLNLVDNYITLDKGSFRNIDCCLETYFYIHFLVSGCDRNGTLKRFMLFFGNRYLQCHNVI